jgi:hypothetical protein
LSLFVGSKDYYMSIMRDKNEVTTAELLHRIALATERTSSRLGVIQVVMLVWFLASIPLALVLILFMWLVGYSIQERDARDRASAPHAAQAAPESPEKPAGASSR